MAKKYGLNFDGVMELSEKLQEFGGDLRETAEETLAFIPAKVNPELKTAMAKHRKSGRVERSIIEGQQVTWTGNVASIDVGFDLKTGGMPSIFLMYGTPRHAPRNQYGGPVRAGAREHPGTQADRQLYNAVYGTQTQKEIKQKQADIFQAAIERAMK